MAFNPDPKVRVAADFAKEFNADRVIIYYTQSDGSYGYASYGRNGRLCSEAGRIADRIFQPIGQIIADEVTL